MTTLTKEMLEHEVARRDFLSFLPYVRIRENDAFSGVAEMAFEPWPHLMELATALVGERFVLLAKARQLGATWCVVAYCYWLAAYHPGVGIIVISKGEKEAKEFLSRMKFIRDRLPAPLASGKDTTERWDWDNESRVVAFAASSDSARSFDGFLVVHDEADFHPDLEGTYSTTYPIIDNGGRHISLSSFNHENGPDSFFKQETLRAKNGVSGYRFLWFDCWSRPDHTKEWYEGVAQRYASEDRLHKEHPRTLEEGLEAPATLQGIPHAFLDEMKHYCREPLPYMEGQPPDAQLFARFWPGKRYAAFTDTSHGTGNDYSVTCVMDCDTETVVADIFSNTLEAGDLAYQSVKLLEMYDSPIWGIEENEWGKVVLNRAEELRYRNIYHRPLSARDPTPGRPGWLTNRQTRPRLWGDLREACMAGHLTVLNEKGLSQFYSLVKNPEREGQIEAAEGRNDDYPMAVGGCLQMKPLARRSRAYVVEGNGQFTVQRSSTSRQPTAPIGRRW